ncbi:MAG: carbamoyltransferase [Candidatus Omnitrophica bacterium]|nr:carbamoyltransferase [Candidatus Omnitrophota bacterium]
MKILGISAFYHDSAACLIEDGRIVAAAQEERFTRKKHDDAYPAHAVAYCLKAGDVTADALDAVAFYDKPILKFDRILKTHLMTVPYCLPSFLKAIPLWINKKLYIHSMLEKELHSKAPIFFPEHHESHAASAFFASPFERAAFVTVDGVGEWATTSFGVGNKNRIAILSELHFPHSLGLLYSAFTHYLGFKINSGEYKLMGLAPYGEPVYVKTILDHLIDLKEDGSYRLNMDYFGYCGGLNAINKKFEDLFGGPAKTEEEPFEDRHLNVARSIQEVLDEAMLKMARHVRKKTGEKYLCLAGGVALNCVSNGKILREKIFDDLWIQPAASDSGGALGAALYVYHQYHKKERTPGSYPCGIQKDSLWGPEFGDEEIERFLKGVNATYQKLAPEPMVEATARELANEKVVGWFQGRMEFGPRALGARSILGDPRSPKMQSVMNLKIKFRESFRPFAPSVMREKVGEYFDLEHDSPYMLLVAPVRDSKKLVSNDSALKSSKGIEKLRVLKSVIPAVTHVDYSARVQTVSEKDNPFYYSVLKAFEKLTGCPLLINTSFNVRGEPIVCTPNEAYTCFMRTKIDVLVMGRFFLAKDAQKPVQTKDQYSAEQLVGTD